MQNKFTMKGLDCSLHV